VFRGLLREGDGGDSGKEHKGGGDCAEIFHDNGLRWLNAVGKDSRLWLGVGRLAAGMSRGWEDGNSHIDPCVVAT
jgi:hypothetical protein